MKNLQNGTNEKKLRIEKEIKMQNYEAKKKTCLSEYQ